MNLSVTIANRVRTLKDQVVKVIVVFTDRGIAPASIAEVDIEERDRKVSYALEQEGAFIEKIYYYRYEDRSYSCRKPDIGIFLKAKGYFVERSLLDSFIIAVTRSDMQAGKAPFCHCTIGRDCLKEISFDTWYHTASSLCEAVNKYFGSSVPPNKSK